MDQNQLQDLMRAQLDLSRRLRARIDELESEHREPLALIGTAMRFPGGIRDPKGLRDFLAGDGTAETPIPSNRPGLRSITGTPGPGRSYVDRAGFLDDVESFDAGFFGISNREALLLDPQQRLLLEICWEVTERAGLPVRRSDRINAGVFVGIMTSDYTNRMTGRAEKTSLDPYYGTGSGHSMAAGRISFALGLVGPALSVDTACSSSLMAAHLAMQSLRRGECDYAFVAGANLIFSPEMMVSLCQSQALARDGRCKSFQDAADGYGRGEGVGVALLTRQSVAERRGLPIQALLRGSAANHDGASSGLTVPNGRAQQAVIRAALADAGVDPCDVGYVEAHGTGTKVGDPIEIAALDATLGSGAPGRTAPLEIGTVKARIGHLEGAAGIAGLMSAAEVLASGFVPMSVPAAAGPLNSLVRWKDIGIRITPGGTTWPSDAKPRIAGVSSFGMSGTNLHLVLQEYQKAPAPEVEPVWPQLLPVSAKDENALRAAATAAADFLATVPTAEIADALHTFRQGRVHHRHRLAVIAAGRDEIVAALRDVVAVGEPLPPSEDYNGVLTLRTGPDLASFTATLIERLPQLAPAGGLTDDGDADITAVLASFGLNVGTDIEPDTRTESEADRVDLLDLSWRGRRIAAASSGDPVTDLLGLLAQAYRSGVAVSFGPLSGSGDRMLPSVPVYPFRRRRFWIEESEPAESGTGTAQPDKANVEWMPVDACLDIRSAVTDAIFVLLWQALAADEIPDPNRSFLDLGGDSFTAMQLTMEVEERFAVTLPVEDVDLEQPLTDMVDLMATAVLTAQTLTDTEVA